MTKLNAQLLASTAIIALLGWAPATLAQSPQGATVVSGAASVTRQGSTTVVTQGTNRGVIDWRSFSIGANEAVRFDQPGRSSVTLNRVTSSEISRIDGSLTATGQVWLSNPNGVMIGPGGQVNVGGLLATTGRIDAAEFLSAGRAAIDRVGKDAVIVNGGAINIAAGGYAALAAASIRNEGVIAARTGTVALGAGKAMTIDFAGDKLITFQVSQPLDQAPAGADAALVNAGTLAAPGGSVLLSARAAKGVMDNVINLKGHVVANSVRVDGGAVIFGDGGAVRLSGSIDASGASGASAKGGDVVVLGEKIGMMDGASIDASGAAGGGTVLIGGDWQGKGAIGAAGQNAQIAYVAPTARINVDATKSGDGGKAVIWADDTTRFSGAISARGGALSGDGGQVETSGKRTLDVASSATVTTAGRAGGKPGAWLLDPTDVTIAVGGGGAITGGIFNPAASSTIDPAVISAALDSGNVTIQTSAGSGGNGDINFVSGTIATASTTTRSFTLLADRHILIQSGAVIDLTGAAHNILLNSAAQATTQSGAVGAIAINAARISTTGGSITLVGGLNGALAAQGDASYPWGITNAGTLTSNGGSILLRGTGSNDALSGHGVVNFGVLSAAAGSITIKGVGGAASSTQSDGIFTSGTISTTGSGSISLTGIGGATAVEADGVNFSWGEIRSETGAISIAGTASGVGGYGRGVLFAIATLTSGGAVSITGTGGGGGNTAVTDGVWLGGASSITTTGSGALTITGVRGNGAGAKNIAINSATIAATGTGAVNLIGTAVTGGGVAGGTNADFGVVIEGGSAVTSGIGGVAIKGNGASYGIYAYGVVNNGVIAANGGAISIIGVGGANANVDATGVLSAGTITTTGAGAITITGTGQGSARIADGVNLSSGLTSSENGSISITGKAAGSVTGRGVLFAQSRLTGGAGVSVAGVGAGGVTADESNTDGVAFYQSTISTTGAGLMTVTGARGVGSGAKNISSYDARVIAFGSGAINLVGTTVARGGVTGGTNADHGIYVDYRSFVTGGAGGVVIRGNGATSGIDAKGVVNDGVISASGGAISIIGVGGANASVNATGVLSNGTISTTGAGAITITGTGLGAAQIADGVNLSTGLTSSENGSISITGAASPSAQQFGRAILLYQSRIASAGNVTIKATGANGDIQVQGASMAAPASLTITGGSARALKLVADRGVRIGDYSAITLAGAAHSVTLNAGAWATSQIALAGSILIGRAQISTTGGAISLVGGQNGLLAAAGDLASPHGVQNSGTLSSGGGGITLRGVGAANAFDSLGVINYGLIDAGGGGVAITGFGGANAANSSVGVWSPGVIQTVGAGAISITGTGGSAGYAADGVNISPLFDGTAYSAGRISAETGAVKITGTGSLSSAGDARGVLLVLATLSSAGAVTMTGKGGAGALNTTGSLIDSSTVTLSGAGSLNATGTRGGSAYAMNIEVRDSALESSAGAITLNGSSTLGGGGGAAYGLKISRGSIATAAGKITLTGAAPGSDPSSAGTLLTNLSILSKGTAPGSGSLTLNGPALLSGSINLASMGAVTINGSMNSLDSTPAGLTVQGSAVIFGDAVGSTSKLASLTTVGAASTTTLTGNVATVGAQRYGGKVLLNGDLTMQTSSGSVDVYGTLNSNLVARSLTVSVGGAGNSLAVAGYIGGTKPLNNLSIETQGGVTLPGVKAANLKVKTNGGIIDQSGAVQVTGLAAFDAGSAYIALNSITTNNFNTLAVVTSGNALVSDSVGGFVLATSMVGDTLTLKSNGVVTQSGSLSAAGLALLGTGGDYRLTDGGNKFGLLSANTKAVDLVTLSTAPLKIGTINDISGLTLTGDAKITVGGGQTLQIDNAVKAGAVSLSAQSLSGTGLTTASTSLTLAAPGGGAVTAKVNGKTGAAAAALTAVTAGTVLVNGVPVPAP